MSAFAITAGFFAHIVYYAAIKAARDDEDEDSKRIIQLFGLVALFCVMWFWVAVIQTVLP